MAGASPVDAGRAEPSPVADVGRGEPSDGGCGSGACCAQVAKSGTSGQRLIEGTNINKSLMTLGMVIGPTAAASAPGLGPPLPRLHR